MCLEGVRRRLLMRLPVALFSTNCDLFFFLWPDRIGFILISVLHRSFQISKANERRKMRRLDIWLWTNLDLILPAGVSELIKKSITEPNSAGSNPRIPARGSCEARALS